MAKESTRRTKNVHLHPAYPGTLTMALRCPLHAPNAKYIQQRRVLRGPCGFVTMGIWGGIYALFQR
jgi:hypothetical protein